MDTIQIELTKRNIKGYCDSRPYIPLETDAGEVLALLDSGATHSVWTKTEDELIYHFNKAYRYNMCEAIVSGFGLKDTRKYPVYIIPELIIADKHLMNLPIVAKNMPDTVSMILQHNIFKKSGYELSKLLTHLVLPAGEIVTFCRPAVVDGILHHVVLFTQDDENFHYCDELLCFAESNNLDVDDVANEVYNGAPSVLRNNMSRLDIVNQQCATYIAMHNKLHKQ